MTAQAAPSIVIVTAAAQPAINAIWEAMGNGPDTFSVKLCDKDPNATWQSPVTAYLMLDMGAQQSDVDVWSAMAQSNDLPPLPAGVVWGENGIISASDAQAALGNESMVVFPAYGIATEEGRTAWIAASLDSRNVQILPSEPFL